MSREPFNVLVCGKIRDPQAFIDGLEVYRRWRADGHVSRIVFSGWSSDWEPHRDLIRSVMADGVEVILTPEPTIRVVDFTFHQVKNLHFGLSLFDDGERVFKSRTDRVFLGFDMGRLVERFDAAPAPAATSPFRRRLMVIGGLLFHPYFLNDMTYAGEAGDLRQLASFDTWFAYQNGMINPEQVFFSAPFSRRDAMLRDYFMVNSGLMHESASLAEQLTLAQLGQTFYLQVLHRWLNVILGSFTVGFNEDAPWTDDGLAGLTLSDLAHSGDPGIAGLRFAPSANTVEFRQSEPLRQILDLPISMDIAKPLSAFAPPDDALSTRRIYSPLAAQYAEAIRAACPTVRDRPPPIIEEPGLRIIPPRHPMTMPL